MASQLLHMPSTPPQASKLDSEQLSSGQSRQLVQVFLNASLACICHTRELFSWSSGCFRTRFIDDVSLDHDPSEIYRAFCSIDSSSTKPSQELRVLVRSNSSRANGFLDMIEHGVFDALKRSYLEVLHVFVTSDAQHGNSILETYTYTFQYHETNVTTVHIGETGKVFSLADSKKSFKAAIRALLRTMKELPTLPKGRALGMSMSFRHHCPESYQPEGFCSARDHSIAIDDWHNLWQTPSNAVLFEAAHHVVKIATRNKEYEGQSASQLEDALMSKRLHNMQRTSSDRNFGIRSTMPVHGEPSRKPQKDEALETQERPTTVRGEGILEHHAEGAGKGLAKGTEARSSPRRRKISVSGRFIQLDRSSPCASLDDEGMGTCASGRSDETDCSEDDFN